MMNAMIPFSNLVDSFFAPSCYVNGEAEQSLRRAPRTDILEGDKDYVIRMDLPGVDREALEIDLENGTLTVKAVREIPAPEGYKALRAELPEKIEYRRAFTLGKGVDNEGIEAKLEGGVLTLTLPKAQAALPKRITIG